MFRPEVLIVALVLFVTCRAESDLADIMSWQYQDDSDVMEHRLTSETTNLLRKWFKATTEVEERATLFELLELILLPVKILVKPLVRFLYGYYSLAV